MLFKYSKFQVFKSEAIGKLFLPDGFVFENTKCIIPTIMHGRSVSIKISDYDWIMVKGGGWNYGGPVIYNSPKESELVFGLFSLFAAKRELDISIKIKEFSNEFPEVLYYKEIKDKDLDDKYAFLKELRFNSGNLVNPTLLYTRVKCPFRVADLIYLSDKQKQKIVSYCSKYFKVSKKKFLISFLKKLANNVAHLHKWGFVNDTLEYSNVTLLGEIVDYELFSYPGILFDDGTDGRENLAERMEKEIFYATEIVLQLAALLKIKTDFYESYKAIVDEYKKINPQFVYSRKNILEICSRKEIVV